MTHTSLIEGRTRWVGGGDGRRPRRVPINAKGQEAQHFLLSAKSVDIDEDEIARLTEEEAYARFEAIRFAKNDGKPFCPHCGALDSYRLTINRRGKNGPVPTKLYKCREGQCRRQFSVTSGTIFASRKMSIRDILSCIMKFVNAASGQAALELRRRKRKSYKCAFVFEGKVREAIALSRDPRLLYGTVEVDGTELGGKARKARLRVRGPGDNLPALRQSQTVLALRERRPNGESRTFVLPNEASYRDPITHADLIRDSVEQDTHMISDEAFSLAYIGPHDRVKHKAGYQIDGVHTNGVEGLFARFKRSERGVYYHLNSRNLDLYAQEVSWREDYRRKSNGEQWTMLLNAVASAPISRRWKGYWQRWEAPDAKRRNRTGKRLQTSILATVQ